MNSNFRFAMTSRARLALAYSLIFSVSGVHADSYLPVACSGGACGTNAGVGFSASGSGSYITNGTVGTVTQMTANEIFNWGSFNIGAGYTVNFENPLFATYSALNRIWDANPSTILGSLNAPGGTIYLINANGIIFGAGAQVSVGSLVQPERAT